jgi:hypothetical protein
MGLIQAIPSGRFFWELAQHKPLPGVRGCASRFDWSDLQGNQDMRIRVAGRVCDVLYHGGRPAPAIRRQISFMQTRLPQSN